MIILSIIAASTSALPLDMEHVYASGNTARIRPHVESVYHAQKKVPVKAKNLITLIPATKPKNDLGAIIERVKQENGLAPKPKKVKLSLRLIP